MASMTAERANVARLLNTHPTFDSVERYIDSREGMTKDQKAALWLFAYSTRGRAEQRYIARQAAILAGDRPDPPGTD